MVFFNHEDIDEVYFEGFRDGAEDLFCKKYNEEISNIKYPRLTKPHLICGRENCCIN